MELCDDVKKILKVLDYPKRMQKFETTVAAK